MRWQGREDPSLAPLSFGQKIRAALRGVVLVVATLILLLLYWVSLAVEKLLPRLGLSTFIIWFWCAMGTWLCGLKLRVVGEPMPHAGARVANHSSWADVFVLRAAAQMYYVAKAEVRGWPLMGMIAAHTGTMFIARDRTQAKAQEAMFKARLEAGDRLCFFPEGTSSDGMRVLPFKSTLFAAFMADSLIDLMWVQPVSVVFAPKGDLLPDALGWYGGMPLASHLAHIFGRSVGGEVFVIFHKAVRATDFPDRKALAAHCEAEVKRGHADQLHKLGRTPLA